jgi:hypothetical protein
LDPGKKHCCETFLWGNSRWKMNFLLTDGISKIEEMKCLQDKEKEKEIIVYCLFHKEKLMIYLKLEKWRF